MTPEEMRMQQMIAQAIRGERANEQDALKVEMGINQRLGPEKMRQQTNLGTLDQRAQLALMGDQMQSGALQKQMAEANAMRTAPAKNYGNTAANIIGGVGDVFGKMQGAYQGAKLGQQQQDLMKEMMGRQSGFLDQQDAGRFDFANARFGSMQDMFNGGGVPYYLAKP